MANRMGKWLHHTFSFGCETGSDYDAFQREARADLRKQAKAAGFALHRFIPDIMSSRQCCGTRQPASSYTLPSAMCGSARPSGITTFCTAQWRMTKTGRAATTAGVAGRNSVRPFPKCGDTFCSKCFIDRHGRKEYMKMMQGSDLIYCPACYEEVQKND